MDTKRQKVASISTSISQSLPILRKNNFNYLPNEILFCIFDYLLPIDIVRAFEYDLPRFGEQSFLSIIQQKSIICNKLIIEYTPSYYRQMNDTDIIPLLSSSVNTLILCNVVFLLRQSTMSYVCNSLQHIRCILKSENDLHEFLIRFPMLISIDIRLISHEISELSTVLPVPKHFRIEYPNETILNFDKFPPLTKYYDQTVYSLPWFDTNSSIVLRSCNPQNYLNSFPHPLSYIRQFTIECTTEPWSFEFVNFLHQTFPNTRTLYAIQKHDSGALVMTIITAHDRKHGKCTLEQPYRQTSTDSTTLPEAIRFLSINRAYN